MKRKYLLNLGPALLIALGIIVGTLAAKLAAGSGWWVMTGPVLLAVSVVCADTLEGRLRGKRTVPSYGALIMAGSFVTAGFIVTLRDPSLVKLLIPAVGMSCWVPLLLRSDGKPRSCRYI